MTIKFCKYLALILLIYSSNVQATRIKDVATFDGVRDNLLVGYGIVVGLNGSGDNLNNAVFTKKGITEFLDRLGVNIQGANLKTKNIAAVTVTADLASFAKQGTRIDIKVSAIGDAKSLKGGTLLATPLIGADGNVYAVGQGLLSIPEFEPASADVKTQANFKIETNGYIQNGAIVENELDFDFSKLSQLKLALHNPDFTTSVKIANAINDNIPGNTASAIDPSSVVVNIPNFRRKDIIQFITEIEALEVKPDYKAKIVVNESTGTIVIGDNVRIRPVAISQGNLIVNVGQEKAIDINMPIARQEQLRLAIDRQRGMGFQELDMAANLSDLVAGLNRLGVWPRDIINVLHSMKAVGALDAAIEVR